MRERLPWYLAVMAFLPLGLGALLPLLGPAGGLDPQLCLRLGVGAAVGVTVVSFLLALTPLRLGVRVGLVALLLLGSYGALGGWVGLAHLGQAGRTPQPQPGPPASGTAWKEFSSPEGGYTILMPGEPIPQPGLTVTVNGRRVPLTVAFTDWEEKKATLKTAHADLPAPLERPDQVLLDASIDPNARGMGGAKIEEARDVQVAGRPGREVRAATPTGLTVLGRACTVDRRLYLVIAIGPSLEFDNPDVEKFFSSFKITAAHQP